MCATALGIGKPVSFSTNINTIPGAPTHSPGSSTPPSQHDDTLPVNPVSGRVVVLVVDVVVGVLVLVVGGRVLVVVIAGTVVVVAVLVLGVVVVLVEVVVEVGH